MEAIVDTRDDKTKFAHQTALHEKRPEITPELVSQLKTNGRLIEAKSFNGVAKSSEMTLVFSAFDGEPVALRMNPDIVFNLGINLLKEGTKLGWFKVDLEDTDPPRLH